MNYGTAYFSQRKEVQELLAWVKENAEHPFAYAMFAFTELCRRRLNRCGADRFEKRGDSGDGRFTQASPLRTAHTAACVRSETPILPSMC